ARVFSFVEVTFRSGSGSLPVDRRAPHCNISSLWPARLALRTAGDERIGHRGIPAIQDPHPVHEDDRPAEVAAEGEKALRSEAEDQAECLYLIVLVAGELGEP